MDTKIVSVRCEWNIWQRLEKYLFFYFSRRCGGPEEAKYLMAPSLMNQTKSVLVLASVKSFSCQSFWQNYFLMRIWVGVFQKDGLLKQFAFPFGAWWRVQGALLANCEFGYGNKPHQSDCQLFTFGVVFLVWGLVWGVGASMGVWYEESDMGELVWGDRSKRRSILFNKHGGNVAQLSKMSKIALDSQPACRFGVVLGIQRGIWHTQWKWQRR